ncbi:MAG TPA: hypothetical protein VFH88_07425 [Candidatus Krumholzibacteria bacterium]|nr:hypothetical protein [Candidatus Krumholzibacteria bacterium]
MRFLPVSRLYVYLFAAVALVLVFGCQPAMIVDSVITTESCADSIHTMSFVMHSNSSINGASFQGGSPNVIDIVALYHPGGSPTDLTVVTALDNAMKHDQVQEKFRAGVTIQGTVVVSLADFEFFQADWPNLGAPDCDPVHSPQYTITYTPAPGVAAMGASPATLSLEVSDPYPMPITLVDLDLVEVPALLDPSLLDWNNATFNGLPWTSVAPGGAMLAASAPPLDINLPDTATGAAVLCRYISIYNGYEVRGIMQLALESSLPTRSSTWGAVKALFRD